MSRGGDGLGAQMRSVYDDLAGDGAQGPPAGLAGGASRSASRGNPASTVPANLEGTRRHGTTASRGGTASSGCPPSRGAAGATQPTTQAAPEHVRVPMARVPTGAGAGARGPPRHLAAASHLENDKYMADWEDAYQKLAALNAGGGGGGSTQKTLGAPRTSSGAAAPRTRAGIAAGTVAASPARAAPGSAAAGALPRYPDTVVGSFRSGPSDAAGVLEDVSDRPSLCSAANWARGEIVVGSSDHALYVIDAVKGKRKRTLYSKTAGHTEWVSCVAMTPEGRVVSGGMDSAMWLWPAGGTRGMRMDGHEGAVSQVEFNPSTGGVVSASYDKSVRLWSVGARGTETACLLGHEAPVLELSVGGDGKIVSGDRSGSVLLWDPQGSSDASWRMKHVHHGHVTALVWADGRDANIGGTFLSGGQDGVLRVWDPRSKSNPAKVQLHVNEQGHGAVSQICAGGPPCGGYIITSGADGTARVLDPRKSFALMSTLKLTNFPYAMAVAGGLALVGCGDGSVHVIDAAAGSTLYALGAHKGAVRAIEASSDKLFTSGDDGNTMLYSY